MHIDFEFLKRAIKWIERLLGKAKDELVQAAVFIVKDIQPVLNSSSIDILAGIADAITGSKLPDKILEQLRKYIPVFLTAEGIITTLTVDSTEEEVKAALQGLVALFPKLSADQRAQLWTTLAAQIYIFLHKLETGEDITFGEAASLVEEAYQALIAQK